MKTLVIVAHPNLQESRANRTWKERLEQEKSVTVHDLYQCCPNDRIDVELEQNLLLEHDRIVLQFPFYWYSTPSLLKKWQDEVYTYGFGYGTGNKLREKEYMLAVSVGRAKQSYSPEGDSLYTMEQLLLPLQATILLTEMRYLPPFIVYHVPQLSDEELKQSAEVMVRYVTSPFH
ncbi:NAD(P)H-dependent oxidoreductase [Cohnella silvisoli]|uniref:NAD(P)H-dependent oxidoreductase n=1 Tax=Cohnella silvisoli TaxID=2873699 RepID=A0ABV1KNJ5_9BACL|nr:NAD(P)H-dependent oxidoreductase [Cohnella silvisoli]MCD9021068.1 NAD(P)H-dependent oxidoreductase [Cohnella silvisoli]